MIEKLSLSVAERPDLSHEIRRLHVFRKSLEAAVAQFNGRYGCALRLDERALTRAFLDWNEALDAQRGAAEADREDFSYFAAGLLLQKLIASAPVTEARLSAEPPEGADAAEAAIVRYWPDGFLYFEFCITVLDAVLRQERLGTVEVMAEANELRAWQSFRENVTNNPAEAIAFLDLFLGRTPNWDFPTLARFREAIGARLADERPAPSLTRQD